MTETAATATAATMGATMGATAATMGATMGATAATMGATMGATTNNEALPERESKLVSSLKARMGRRDWGGAGRMRKTQ